MRGGTLNKVTIDNRTEMRKRFHIRGNTVDRAKRNSRIRDVALLAGCGIASASRVLNQSGYVSPQLREKVLAAAPQLGFDFSDVDRSLRNQTTKTISSSDRALQRLEGLRRACSDLGFDMPAVLEIDDRPHELKEDLDTFLRTNPETTGIFASNDQLAIAIIAALRELGLRVPSDLSIIGFDGIEFGQMLKPILAIVVTEEADNKLYIIGFK